MLLGALLSRLHGSTKLPYKVVKSLMWATPFALVASLFVGWWAFAVLGGCALFKSTGHGGFMDLGTWLEPREQERLEFLLDPIDSGEVSDYWYDAIGLSLTGFFSVLPFAIAMLWVNPIYSLITILGGLLKPLGYILGQKILPNHFTVVGEIFSGASAYFVLDYICSQLWFGLSF